MRYNHVLRTISIGAVLLGFASLAWSEELDRTYRPGPPDLGEPLTYTKGLPPGVQVGTPPDESLAAETSVEDMKNGFVGQIESRVYRDGDNTCTFAYRITWKTSGHNLFRAAFYEAGSTPWMDVDIVAFGSDGSGRSTPAGRQVFWTDGSPRYIARDSSTAGPVIRWKNNNDGTEIARDDYSAMIWFKTTVTCSKRSTMELGSQGGPRVAVLVPDKDHQCGDIVNPLCSSGADWGRLIAAATAGAWNSPRVRGWLDRLADGWLDYRRWQYRAAWCCAIG